jgi:hypothetical protein
MMQKIGGLFLFSFVLIFAIAGSVCGQNRNSYVSDKFNYSVNYPSGYKVKDLNDIVMFSSPSADKKFAFSANVNITVRQYPEPITDLQGFFNQAKRSLKASFKEIKIIEEKKDMLDKRPAYRMTFTLKQKEAKFKIMQILLTNRRLAYAITYTALENEFNKYLKEGDTIIKSFHILN